MTKLSKFWVFFALFNIILSASFALEEGDCCAIQGIIHEYANAWNYHEGRGFADHFTDDASFINIFGMKFTGRSEIEERHVQILQTFLKGSFLEILDFQLREVLPGAVVALVHWKLAVEPGSQRHGKIQEGIFTQLFINLNKKWEITASQNTLITSTL